MMSCNSHHQGGLRDATGRFVGWMVNGTHDGKGVVDMASEAADYVADTLSPNDTFLICIETADVISVQLADGTDFIITATQAGAHLGQWYPANIKKVYKSGTSGTFSVGW